MTIAETLSPEPAAPIYLFGPFRYDSADRLLTRDGVEVALPPRVIGVLHVLLDNHGRVVSKTDLIEAVWSGTFVTETSLTEAVSVLRQALGDEPQTPSFVQTVHRRGYRFVAPVTRDDREAIALAPAVPLAPVAAPVLPERPRRSHRTLIIAAAAIAAIALVLAGAQLSRIAGRDAEAPRATHLNISVPAGQHLVEWMPSVAISPDGRDVVFVATDKTDTRLYHRTLDSFETRALAGTDGATQPFFSPDGEWVGFVTKTGLMKMRLGGGVPIEICKAERATGAAWNTDGTIVFGTHLGGLRRVPENGGRVEVLTRPNAARGEVTHAWPELLPDGRSLLFTIFSTTLSTAKVALLSLDTRQSTVLLDAAGGARYAPSGHIVYARPDVVAAVAFDAESGRITGSPVPLLREVAVHPFYAFHQVAIARNGTLIYMPQSRELPTRRLARVSARGTLEPLALPQRFYRNLEIAPDGRRAAVTILTNDRSDVWIAGLEDGSLERMTFDGFNIEPVWSPDGEWVYYASNRGGPYNIYRRRANGQGSAERVMASERHQYPYFWAPDGRLLVYGAADEETGLDVWLAEPQEGGGWKTSPFLRTRALEGAGEVSPDGRWYAHQSDEGGSHEIYLRELPRAEVRRQISTGGGTQPFWSADGRTLYYHSAERVMAVTLEGDTLKSEVVFADDDIALAQRGGANNPLTLIENVEQAEPPTELRVILGWESALAAKQSTRAN